MSLDIQKLSLTPEEIGAINARHGNLVGGLRASKDAARAQLAKALLGPDGIIAWLNGLAENEPDIQVCEVLQRLGKAAHAAGLE